MSTRNDSLLDGRYWEEPKKSTYLRDATKWSIETLRPAIFTKGSRKQSRRTAYLDGLRGFAAFLVYWQHHQLWPRYKYKIMGADYILENGFGSCCHFLWFGEDSRFEISEHVFFPRTRNVLRHNVKMFSTLSTTRSANYDIMRRL
jgi:hypothetical protein